MRMVEGRRGTVGMLSRMAARVEAASPAPRVLSRRNADPLSDRADADIDVIDVPAFVRGFEIAARVRAGIRY